VKPRLPRWLRWSHDPLAEATGISFDRTPQGRIAAPRGQYRVCAYHIDFDERPTVYVDVATLAEAVSLCDDLADARGDWNVDYAVVYDDEGNHVHGGY